MTLVDIIIGLGLACIAGAIMILAGHAVDRYFAHRRVMKRNNEYEEKTSINRR